MIELFAIIIIGLILLFISISYVISNNDKFNEQEKENAENVKFLKDKIETNEIEIMGHKILFKDVELVKLEQILIATTKTDERKKIEDLIEKIKEVIPNEDN